MAKASPEVTLALEDALNQASVGLKKVSSKKMFGCHALWANGNIFALIWKEGRIGFKLPDHGAYENLLATSGSTAWTIGPKKMSHWVLVPEGFHKKNAQLKKWAEISYGLCEVESPKKPKPAKKAKAVKKAPAKAKKIAKKNA